MRAFAVAFVIGAAVCWPYGSPVRLASADLTRDETGSCVVIDAAPARRAVTWRVREGDTLSGIALRIYGDERLWKAIREANADRLGSDGVLRAGVELAIPARRALSHSL